MKRKTLYIATILIALSYSSLAASLWKPSQEKPYADSKGRGIGSVVTVLISESARATQQASTSTDASETNSAGGGTGFLQFVPLGGSNTSAKYSGAGTTSRSGSLTASITATVVEELPSGLLKVEGTRRVKINDELQEITVRGLVRPEDVAKDNTILSVYLADAEILYRGLGSVGRTQKPGIINRLMHFLF